MTEIRIPVLASQQIRSYPKHAAGGMAQPTDLATALTRSYATDAHFAGYAAPSNTRRLSSGALSSEPIAVLGGSVRMVLGIVDVDCPTEEVDAWWRTERTRLDQLLGVHPGLYAYRTRGGYRIVGRLEPEVALRSPEDAPIWSRYYLALLAYLERAFGIVGDRACADWTRLYRLPRVVRDPGGPPENRETIGDPNRIGAWRLDLVEEIDRRRAEEHAGPARSLFVSSAPSGPGYALRELFAVRGWLGKEQRDGRYYVLCPWRAEHSTDTDGTSSTIIMPPSGGTLGSFRCAHAHCDRRSGLDVLRLFTADEIDEANGRPTRAQRSAARRPPWPTEADAPPQRQSGGPR